MTMETLVTVYCLILPNQVSLSLESCWARTPLLPTIYISQIIAWSICHMIRSSNFSQSIMAVLFLDSLTRDQCQAG